MKDNMKYPIGSFIIFNNSGGSYSNGAPWKFKFPAGVTLNAHESVPCNTPLKVIGYTKNDRGGLVIVVTNGSAAWWAACDGKFSDHIISVGHPDATAKLEKLRLLYLDVFPAVLHDPRDVSYHHLLKLIIKSGRNDQSLCLDDLKWCNKIYKELKELKEI